MNIIEIKDYFEKVKKIDIYSRKDFIKNIFEEANINLNYKDILNTNDFLEIKELSKYFKNQNNSKKRKQCIIEKINKFVDNNNNNINILYIKIIKLLTLDNSNEKLVEIYLIFLNFYQNNVANIFSIQDIELFKNEVKYYKPCFSGEDYMDLFGLKKKCEKDIVFNFLEKASKIKNYNYDNSDLKKLMKKAKKLLKRVPDFNQPIEFDNPNIELKWHKIKIIIAVAFNSIELIPNNQDKLGQLKNGVKTVFDRELLKNKDIMENKDKLDCALILISNPCKDIKDCQFCANLLLSHKLDKNDIIKIKNDYKFIKDPEDIEDICLNNISEKFSYQEYELKERYNFNYLIEKYVSNQTEIKQFLKNILTKKVFIEAYKILFGNDDYKLLNGRYMLELINKRLKFAPIRPNGAAALSDKMSLNTYIVAKKRIINEKETEDIQLILYTGCYVSIEEHEIFHLLDSLPHYENNCSLSIKTPRKKNFEGEAEGGSYLEYLLFNRVLKELNLREILYILNEQNYDKTLSDFREGFKNLDTEDLKIKGVFSKFNNYIQLDNNIDFPSKFKSLVIRIKSSDEENLYVIKYQLKNDVFGNKPFI